VRCQINGGAVSPLAEAGVRRADVSGTPMIVSLRRIALSAMVALCNIRCRPIHAGAAGRVDHDERMNIQDAVVRG
jgi:hypothetical protein